MALPRGVFCPMDTQPVLLSRDALWAAFLPLSLPPRLGLSLRSLLAQKLVWEIGGNTVFLPPPEIPKALASLVARLKQNQPRVRSVLLSVLFSGPPVLFPPYPCSNPTPPTFCSFFRLLLEAHPHQAIIRGVQSQKGSS